MPFAEVHRADGATLWSAIESAAESASIGVYVAHIDVQPPRILYVNECAAKIVGRPANELIGQAPWSIMRDADKPTIRSLIDRPSGAPPASLELVIERPDGTHVPIVLAATRMQTAVGLLSFGYFRDITSERDTLAALKRSEARFRFLVEAAPDGVVILQRGTISFMNPKARTMLGVASTEDGLGKPIAAFLPAEDARLAGERIGAMMRDGVEFPPSEYGTLADPAKVIEIKSIVCEWNGGPAVLAFARDVTERKAIERRLVESERLVALGTLAAGVAHEINNPLTYAQLSAQRVRRIVEGLSLPDETATLLRGHLDDIAHGIKRVASITHSLRAFVSDEDDAVGPVNLDVVIDRALAVVSSDLRDVARLVRETTTLPLVFGSPTRLEQVIVNVLSNAIKALPLKPATPHELRVKAEHAGDRVTITIADTGCGIPASARSRIFDPFFTTRDIGQGIGLGLSMAKTIVEKLGGNIEVDSVENVGTTVRVCLRVYRS